jgi:hypothetical protein
VDGLRIYQGQGPWNARFLDFKHNFQMHLYWHGLPPHHSKKLTENPSHASSSSDTYQPLSTFSKKPAALVLKPFLDKKNRWINLNYNGM